ncbi:ribonuclease HII [Patescibacteria group bacterium]|nr:ribonuclease HII [Patescibacteria group bacterium]
MSKLPTCTIESHYSKLGSILIGIDEVGRGAVAGPITVAGVCLTTEYSDQEKQKWEQMGLNDSKKLSLKKREIFSEIILKNCHAYSIQSSSVDMINEKGIVFAFQYAVQEIIKDLSQTIPIEKMFVLMDAFPAEIIPASQQKAIIRGDQECVAIAAASIIAKVYRDNFMAELDKEYDGYDWAVNKGYGTQKHRDAIKTRGPSSLHRALYIRNVVKSV